MRRIGGTPSALLLVLSLGACTDAMLDRPGMVATVGPHTLTVGETVSLLRLNPQLPATPDVVEALAELWTDYTLLARVALEDSALAAVDLSSVVDQRVDAELVRRLRETALEVDTTVTDAELDSIYRVELPGARVRARHILLAFPQGDAAARDSALSLAAELRQRIVAGESFQELASRYSRDPSTAQEGGDLGFFQRNDMVAPFADAAFALEPGEISDPVETIYGVHVIRTEDRQIPPLDSVRGPFRNAVLGRRIQQAESILVAGIEEVAQPELQDGALGVVQSLAAHPGTRLSGRAAGRALVRWDGGAYTAADLQRYLQNQTPAFRDQAARAPSEQIEPFLMQMARGKILVEQARDRGLEVPAARQDTFAIDARVLLVQSASRLGLRGGNRAEGETVEQAVDRLVMQTLSDVMSGRRQVVPLGGISHALRRDHSPRVLRQGLDQVVDSLAALRAAEDASAPPDEQPQPAPEAPDSAG